MIDMKSELELLVDGYFKNLTYGDIMEEIIYKHYDNISELKQFESLFSYGDNVFEELKELIYDTVKNKIVEGR